MKYVELSCRLFLYAVISFSAFYARPNEEIEKKHLQYLEEDKLLEQVAKVYSALEQIQKYYINDLEYDLLGESIIKQLTESLDKNSNYFNQKEFAYFEASTSGSYAGIGVKLYQDLDKLKIAQIFPNTPADEAGLKVDDIILSIDNSLVTSSNVESLLQKMIGIEGSVVHLDVKKETLEQPTHYVLKRKRIEINSVFDKFIDDVAYIKINQFTENTTSEFKKAIKRARKNKNLTGVVIDLRDNPGGLLESAIAISDMFLEKGTIVSTKGKFPESNFKYIATKGDILEGKPLVILQNKNSASGAEILAGALQDHKRALVLGDISYGKGTVQSLFRVEPDGVLKLTIAHYYTPNGKNIDKIGIIPDKKITLSDLEKEQNKVLETKNNKEENVITNEIKLDKQDLVLAKALEFI